jgi:hypothetical protein
MLTDDHLAASIGDRLHAEVADIEPPPELLTTLRRRQARRAWAIRGVAGSSLAATAGVLALVLAGAGPPSPATTAGGTPKAETVAFVAQQATAALARTDQFVEKTETGSPAGDHYVTWIDAATRRDRSNAFHQGRPATDIAMSTAPSGTTTVTVVDHASRAWWSYRTDYRPGKITGTPILSPKMPELSTPDGIRDAITNGGLQLLGHDQVDGRDTLHVRLSPQVKKQVDVRLDLWVDATSYLPVKSELVTPIGTMTMAYSWLPRTADNLAQLELVPPANYTHRAGPPDGPPVPPGSKGVG